MHQLNEYPLPPPEQFLSEENSIWKKKNIYIIQFCKQSNKELFDNLVQLNTCNLIFWGYFTWD